MIYHNNSTGTQTIVELPELYIIMYYFNAVHGTQHHVRDILDYLFDEVQVIMCL